MLVLTTPTIEGRKIQKHLGTVSGSAVLGENLFKDFSIGLGDIVGGHSGAYEKEFLRAKDKAIKQMTEEAEGLGANAVVAAEFAYQTIERERIKGSTLVIIITGTAVVTDLPL